VYIYPNTHLHKKKKLLIFLNFKLKLVHHNIIIINYYALNVILCKKLLDIYRYIVAIKVMILIFILFVVHLVRILETEKTMHFVHTLHPLQIPRNSHQVYIKPFGTLLKN